MKKSSLGFVVQYYGFRNDMRNLILKLSEVYDLTLFVENRDSVFDIPDHIDIVEIVSQKKRLYNVLLRLVYRMFGNKPRSKKSYVAWLDRRYSVSDKSLLTFCNYLMEIASVNLPTLVDFDWYLSRLKYDRTETYSVEKFLTFSDVNDVYFLAQLLDSGKSVFTYVYSWDHAGKYFKFSRNRINYFVWNNGMMNDLVGLHGVNQLNIRVLGSTQLTVVHDYLFNSESRKSVLRSDSVVYFAASMGYGPIAEQEVEIARLLAKKLKKYLPNFTLLFRPYPLLKDWNIYSSLLQEDNVIIEDYRDKGKKVVFTEKDVEAKFNNIQRSVAVFHCGSTLGMEAAYFDTPVFFICLEEFEFEKSYSKRDTIQNVFNQHHINKYLKLENPFNVIQSSDQIETILKTLPELNDSHLGYNRQVAQATELASFNSILSKLTQMLNS